MNPTADPPGQDNTYYEEKIPSDCDEPHYVMVNGEPEHVEEEVITRESTTMMYRCLFGLSCIELFVVILRYGLDSSKCPHFFEYREGGLLDLTDVDGGTFPLQEIGNRLSITRERVRQIERCALDKMRLAMCEIDN